MTFEKILKRISRDSIDLDKFQREIEELKSHWKNKDINTIYNRIKNLEGKPESPQKERIGGHSHEKTSDIPEEMRVWISKNLKRGFTPEQLKKAIIKQNGDPSIVDMYMNKH